MQKQRMGLEPFFEFVFASPLMQRSTITLIQTSRMNEALWERLTFLCSVEERSVLWSVANLNDLCSGQELHDQARRHDGRNTQLHQRTWNTNVIVTFPQNVFLPLNQQNSIFKQTVSRYSNYHFEKGQKAPVINNQQHITTRLNRPVLSPVY